MPDALLIGLGKVKPEKSKEKKESPADEAISEAIDLIVSGKKKEAAEALKAAIELCSMGHSEDEDEEEDVED